MPDHIPKPPYVGSPLLPEISSEYQIPDSEGLAHMRAACELAARVLDYAGTLVRVRNCSICIYLSVKCQSYTLHSDSSRICQVYNISLCWISNYGSSVLSSKLHLIETT